MMKLKLRLNRSLALRSLVAIVFVAIQFGFLIAIANGAEEGEAETPVVTASDVKTEAKTESNRIAVVVNKYLKQEINANLDIYLQDLKNEGYEPILREWDLEGEPAPQALKAYLKGLYLEKGSLQGAVFIGDLPVPLMEADPSLKDIGGGLQILNGYPAERYYMDLVGKDWTDEDRNYKFEEPDYQSFWKSFFETVDYYTPEILKQFIGKEDLYPIPEIWTSRIVTSTLTDIFGKSEGQLVNTYLEKNHAYRSNNVVFQKQALIYSLPKSMKGDLAFTEAEFIEPRRKLSSRYILKEPVPGPAQVDEFFKSLQDESYEILIWARHGMKTEISLGTQDLTSDILKNTIINVSTAFVFPNSCWIGHYIEPAYFSGSYLFNERFYALAMPTATLPTYEGPESLMISNFINNENLGTAFKKALETPTFSTFSLHGPKIVSSLIESSNSRFILGDGTLKLQSNDTVSNYSNIPQKYLSENFPFNINARDERGITPLHNAALEGNITTAEFLIKKGADVNAKDKFGATPLDLAIIWKNLDITKLLLESGADVNTKDVNGRTPLHIAVEDDLNMVSLLIKNGANVNARDNQGETPLDVAKGAFFPNNDIIKLLIENGTVSGSNSNAND